MEQSSTLISSSLTSDIALRAVRVPERSGESGTELAPGVYFRMLLGAITGYGNFDRDAGILVPPRAKR